MATIKEHIKHLQDNKPEQFAEFEADLARKDLFRHFDRSVVGVPKYNLKNMKAPLVPILKEYFPFEDKHFSTNTLPDLQIF